MTHARIVSPHPGRRPAARARVAGAFLLVAATLAACKDDGLSPGDPGIRVVAGAEASDTIQRELPQALVVEVRDADGGRAEGVIVRFTSPPLGGNPFGPFNAFLGRLDSPGPPTSSLIVDTTDARGRASALVKLGGTAGPARIEITVPEFGYSTAATYTVLPGAAARVVALPADTVMYVGSTATLRSAVTDRLGNPRTDPVTTSLVSGPAIVSGLTVTAQGIGVAKVRVAAIGASDTTTIAIVPQGVLAVANAGVTRINLDGSGRTTVTSNPAQWVRWAPNGSAISFDNYYSVPARIVTLDGSVRSVRLSSAGTEAEMYPVFSPDGAWVYLSVVASGEFKLWRVRADGTGAERVTSSSPEDDFYPSPSPDGTRLAYVRRTGGGGDYIRILTLATGDVNKIDVPGHAPAWSPLGDMIAYVDIRAGYALSVMRPDGTGQRQISPGGGYELSVHWSPDAKWLVAYHEGSGRIHLIDVATGETFILSYSANMRSPSWKP